MKIEAPSENKIIVDLTGEDMCALDITYEEMDYSNIETRRVIWTLLDQARQTLGRDIDPTVRMLIEAMPKKSGGCVLSFTVMAEEERPGPKICKPVFKKDDNVFTYEFDDIDDLYSAANGCLVRMHGIDSELYGLEGRYRLLLSVHGDIGAVKSFMTEYADLRGTGALQAAHTREHWKLLAADRAIEKLNCKRVL